ncbi:MAG: hypothetical protein IJY90_01110 [Clostridia bacterium]|nr:hypothetical protein [Clostridia bacterium]
MKKSSKIVLSLLCLCPVILSACSSVTYHPISLKTNESSFGHPISLGADKFKEDSTITINAAENNPASNPLVAWVKDNEYLVKIAKHTEDARDTSYSFAVNADTAGEYTAVFQENNASSMMYAFVSDISLSINGEEKEEFEYNLSYAILSSGSNNYLPYEDKIGNEYKTNILYFDATNSNYEFKFKVDGSFNMVGAESEEKIAFTNLTCGTWISMSNFESCKMLEFDFDFVDSINTPGTGKFTISLEKFSVENFDAATQI